MFVDLPLGHTTGLPGDADGQRLILTDGLNAAAAITEPGTIVDLDLRYVDDDWKDEPLSWSRKRQDGGRTGGTTSPAGEGRRADTRTARSADPVYQSDDDRMAAEAVPEAEQCLACLGLGER